MSGPLASAQLTLGPLFFLWEPTKWRDFYFRIADEAPVDVVYLGETVCAKRHRLTASLFSIVADRLERAGKAVILSGVAEVASSAAQRILEAVCRNGIRPVEANNAAALTHLKGRPHHIGPFINVYNERTVAVLAQLGARSICLPAELPVPVIARLAAATSAAGAMAELQVFGRMSLAVSGRCYHARAHGRTRDSCRFVCGEDPDGMPLRAIDGQPFLVVNGIQTLSLSWLNLMPELGELRGAGVTRFRLMPHSCDMVAVARLFRDVVDGRTSAEDSATALACLLPGETFSNGFYYGRPGFRYETARSVLPGAAPIPGGQHRR